MYTAKTKGLKYSEVRIYRKHKNLSNSMAFADFITIILQPVSCLHYGNLQANEQFVSYTAFYSVFLTFKTSYGVISRVSYIVLHIN